MKKAAGCLLRGTVALILVGIIAAVAVSFLDTGDKEKHTLVGEVLALKEDGIEVTGDTCVAAFGDFVLLGGETIYVEDGSTDGTEATLSSGIVTPEGNCSFEFVVDVEETDLYAFTVNNQANLRKTETIGKEIPDGLRHSEADSGDWWVSMWSTDFDD